MGFFKDLGELHRLGQESAKSFDPAAQMARANQQMAQAQQMMAQQTTAATLAATGVDATATVVAVRQPRGMINFQPIMDVDLTVFPPSGPPYPVSTSQPVSPALAAQLAPGASLRVKLDPQNAQSIWIDPTS